MSNLEAAPPSPASTIESPERFTPRDWVILGLIFVAGALLRWLALDMRPMHHDESLHGMYGRYFFDFPEQSFYKYDPMLHGPFLYNMLRFVYNTLGTSIWSVRAPIALLGTLLIFLPLLARRYFSKTTVIALTAVVALSPTLIYWSRFIREDIPSLCSLLLMVYAVTLAPHRLKSIVFLFGFAWMFTIKENSFVTTAILFGYVIFDLLVTFIRARPLNHTAKTAAVLLGVGLIIIGTARWGGFGAVRDAIVAFHTAGVEIFFGSTSLTALSSETVIHFGVGVLFLAMLLILSALALLWLVRIAPDSALAATVNHIRSYPVEFLVGVFLATLWFCYLFSAGFRYSEGILDGLFRKSIGYWLTHHSMERIKGPFNFHFYVLSWYELPFILAFFFHLVTFYVRAPLWGRIVGGAIVVGIVVAIQHTTELIATTNRNFIDAEPLWQIFKLKDRVDIAGLFIFLIHPFVVSLHHTLRRERALAIWGYLFTANLFTYSYLGEKVPWLSIYPFVAGIIYLALYFDDYFRARPLPVQISWESIFLILGSVLGGLALVFVFEDGFGPNRMLLGLACLILGLGYLEGWRRALGHCAIRGALLLVFCVYSIRAAILTNYTYAGKANEFLSQVHTTHEFHSLVMKIRDEIRNPPSGKRPTLLGIEDAVWPITWYMIDIPQYKFSATDEERPGFTYIFQNFKDPVEKLPPGWNALKVPLRGWWVPDYSQMTLKRYLAYALNHTPWNDPGYSDLSFLSNPTR